MSKNSRVILSVPYEEKEEAKQRGAKWDPLIKRWYVDADQSLEDFKGWFSQVLRDHDQKIKSPIYLLKSELSCWSCGELTAVYALAGGQVLEGFEPEEKIYTFSYISKIDAKVSGVLEKLCPKLYLDSQKSSKLSYFMNHCFSCNASQNDRYIHHEAGGPFYFEDGRKNHSVEVEKLDLFGSFAASAETSGLREGVLSSLVGFQDFKASDEPESSSSKEGQSNVKERRDLSLVNYWGDVLTRSAFEAYGKLKSGLENIDKFSWANAENILETVLCKDLENLASEELPSFASGQTLVRHLVMLAESDSEFSRSNIVVFVFPLRAQFKGQEEPKENGIQYNWTRAGDELPIFNHRLIGEEAEIEGFHLFNEKEFNEMLSDQSESENFPTSASLSQCLSFIDQCFSSLCGNSATCQDWIEKFHQKKAEHSLLRNKKIFFRLVDGSSVSGPTKSIRHCYDEVLEMKGIYQKKCKLFYNFTGIESVGFQEAFEEKEKIKEWKSPSLYLGNMDYFSNKEGRAAYALDRSQRLALTLFKQVKDGGVLAVNGPPGTGKTSFLRAVIADHWVQPLLSDELQPSCPIILAVAATNQAVTNIISSFDAVPGPSLFSPDAERNTSREVLESRWIPFLSSYGWYHPASINAKKDDYKNYQLIAYSLSTREWEFHGSSKGFNAIKDELEILENSYLSIADRFFGRKDSLKGHAKRLRDKVKDINEKLNYIEALLLDWKKSLEALKVVVDKGGLEEEFYNFQKKVFKWKSSGGDIAVLNEKIRLLEYSTLSLKICLKRIRLLLRKDLISRGIFLFKYKMRGVSREELWKKTLNELSKNGINQIGSGSDKIALSEGIISKIQYNHDVVSSLKADKNHLEDNIAHFDVEYKKLKQLKEEQFSCARDEYFLRKKLINNLSLLSLDSGLEAVFESIASKFHSLESFNREEVFQNLYSMVQDSLDTVIRPRIFHLCARYWEAQYILARKENDSNMSSSLVMLRELAMLAPVFVATAYSLPRLMRSMNQVSSSRYMYGAADFLIVDEAGQSSPEIGGSSFLFAKKAIVVGDTKQLSPVSSFSLPIDKLIYNKHFPECDYVIHKDRGDLASSGSVMKMAQCSSSYYDLGQDPKGVMLTRHYRCREPIITICNEMFYGGALKVVKAATEPKSPWDVPLGYLVVPGASTRMAAGSRCNYEEAKWIARWIKEKSTSIIAHYGSGSDVKKLSECVAVLTPFKGQVAVLKSEIAKAFIEIPEESGGLLDPHDIVVGTVHAMQGAEKPIILFSMTETEEIDSEHFYDRDPSIINVAVSRAKEVLIVAMDQKAVNYGRKLSPQMIQKPSDYLFYHIVKHGQRVNSKRLMIIESPNKVTHIAEALSQGMELEILPTLGHLTKLDAGPDWDPLDSDSPKWEVLSEIEEGLYRKVAILWPDLEAIYIATDPDAEGECIAWQFLNRARKYLPPNASNKIAINRMVFFGLSASEIRSAYFNPRVGLDSGLVKSALFRAILDQIISRHYPSKIGKGKENSFFPGVGRVQLAIIDILDLFLSSSKNNRKYFIEVTSNAPDGDEMKFILSDCKTSDPVLFPSKEQAEEVAKAIQVLLKKKPVVNLKYGYKLEQLEEYPAINTARILSLCDSECNISPADAMKTLQELYEGSCSLLEEQSVELV